LKALLDTHVLLWWLADPERLSRRARSLFDDSRAELYWSAVSSWELAIKTALGRLTLPGHPRSLVPKILTEQSIRPLDITHAHALSVGDLPPHHADPFDRLLISQARLEKLSIVTSDVALRKYGVRVVW
jgi:PIN domain nuclease of toxin-antitoxin system